MTNKTVMGTYLTSLSKFLSYVLRHHPESIGLSVDENGWVSVSELIEKAGQHGKSLDRPTLDKIIHHGSKKRFILSEEGNYIRAGYGHSIDVNLDLQPKPPPDVLYHGTAENNVVSILREGIHPGSRNFVHLSAGKEDALQVGSRHGKPVILTVQTGQMSKEGYDFYQSESEPGIWLTKNVSPKFVERSS